MVALTFIIMTEVQKYFIALLSSHLNKKAPQSSSNIDWIELFKLAELHNLTGIIAVELKKLPADKQPNDKVKSYFNQVIGLTIQNTELKNQGIKVMKNALSQAKIMHTIIKGGAIRKLYPAPELRTSGDTDVVIQQEDKEKVKNILLNAGFKLKSESVEQVVLNYLDQEFQFKTYFDCLTKTDRLYFSTDLCDSDNGFTYYLKPKYHLIYVINHLLKHVKSGGVGLRQLMDVDVILRNESIDLNDILPTFKEMNIEKSALVIIALAKRLFNTPINLDYSVDNELFNKIIDMMLTGGVFGFANANPGTVRLANNGSKLKALKDLLFTNKEYMYNTYMYANEHHFLLPIAYIHRLINAVFKRGKRNTRSIKSIITNDKNAIMLAEIQKELQI